MARKTEFASENYYHIYGRGTEKRDIFLNNNDYFRFLILLYLCNSKKSVDLRELFREGLTFAEIMQIKRQDALVDIGAYCLMTNHIHLLAKPKDEKSISCFMQKLFTAYTMYFNKKHKRTGRLFESTFKARLVDKDEYLKYLFAYIHLNPVKLIEPKWKEVGIENFKKAKEFLKNYYWSSCNHYLNGRDDPILNTKEFPEYFESSKEFDDFVGDCLNYCEFAKV